MGYRIESVSKDGEAYVFSSSGAEFTSDGDYVIHLTGSTGYPPFTVDFTLDTVPPRLMLEGVEDGKAVSGEVMLISDDTSAAITVLLNGNDIGYRGGSLKKNGTYTVTVTDRAGNFSAYEFVIPYKMNITAVLLIVLLAMLLGGGALYLFRLRRNVKLEL
ncbi:MAG: hypothetical protein FWH02_07070 [Oscillospiraceae bacterium]|nr:hypothetical protein [Oscillospiraceae bacterium]